MPECETLARGRLSQAKHARLVRITDKWEPVIGEMIRINKKLDRGFDSIKT